MIDFLIVEITTKSKIVDGDFASEKEIRYIFRLDEDKNNFTVLSKEKGVTFVNESFATMEECKRWIVEAKKEFGYE